MDAQGSAIKQMVDKAKISIILDNYDDIFSDFDPAPYSERVLSEDFLIEARKRARDKRRGIELQFLIPQAQRNESYEVLITQRLKSHFKKQYKYMRKSFAKSDRLSVVLMSIGLIVGLTAALLLSSGDLGAIASDAVGILFTIVCWYSIWTGMDRLIFKPRDQISDMEFFRKMANAKIIFVPYNE